VEARKGTLKRSVRRVVIDKVRKEALVSQGRGRCGKTEPDILNKWQKYKGIEIRKVL
jgi:hypothetical protein